MRPFVTANTGHTEPIKIKLPKIEQAKRKVSRINGKVGRWILFTWKKRKKSILLSALIKCFPWIMPLLTKTVISGFCWQTLQFHVIADKHCYNMSWLTDIVISCHSWQTLWYHVMAVKRCKTMSWLVNILISYHGWHSHGWQTLWYHFIDDKHCFSQQLNPQLAWASI